MAKLAGPSSRLIDLGANIGLYSVTAAFAGSKLLAFEPVPRTAKELGANLDQFSGAVIRTVAVSGVSGKVTLSGDNVGARIVDWVSGEAPLVRLDGETEPTAQSPR